MSVMILLGMLQQTHTGCSASPNCNSATQVVAILASGQALPFTVASVKLDLPELQVRLTLRCFTATLGPSCVSTRQRLCRSSTLPAASQM